MATSTACTLSANPEITEWTPVRDRIPVLDVLRGVSILGILIVNIQTFAMVSESWWNPQVYPDATRMDLLIWTLVHVLAEGKFFTLLSVLFGAGIYLMAERLEHLGEHSGASHYRRMSVLFLLGFVHAYLFWGGDVLVSYAICGSFAYALRGLRPRLLLLSAAIFFIAGSLFVTLANSYFFAAILAYAPDFLRSLTPAAETAAYSGNWIAQMKARVPMALQLETLSFVCSTFWQITALMLAGMALAKLNLFRNALKTSTTIWIAVAGCALGIPITFWGTAIHQHLGWQSRAGLLIDLQLSYWASPLIAGFYAACILLIVRCGRFKWATDWAAALGRMALSNYLAQTLICTTIFYGHGFGFFGHMHRSAQMALVISIWAAQTAASVILLKSCRLGPAEWLLRAITYKRWEVVGTTEPELA